MSNDTMNDKYFKHLQNQIFTPKIEDKDYFIVFPYEAGSGKSTKAKEYLAKLAVTTNTKALYVQLFTKNNELQKTVDEINKHTETDVPVAMKWDSKDSSNKETMNAIREIPILCITHQMYFQICRGEHKELLEGRELLIIDEFPEIVHPIVVTQADYSILFTGFHPFPQHEKMVKLGEALDQQFWHYYLPKYKGSKKEEWIMSFSMNEEERKDYLDNISALKKEVKRVSKTIGSTMDEKRDDNTEEGTNQDTSGASWKMKVLEKMELILTNPSYFFQEKIYTYDHRFQFVRLNNNIILDANGKFDKRYFLDDDTFRIWRVPNLSDYSSSWLTHIQAKTNISAYRKNPELGIQILDKIEFLPGDDVLIVTKVNYERKINEYIHMINKKYTSVQFKVDHFGNLLGKNDYKDYNVIVVLATPNFPYITYFINYLYFKKADSKNAEAIKIFGDPDNKDVELVRQYTLAGAFYQAIRRINRSNTKAMRVFVATENEEAVALVKEQFRNIQEQPVIHLNAKKGINQQRGKKAFHEARAKELVNALVEYRTHHGDWEITKKKAQELLKKKYPTPIEKNDWTRIIKAAEKEFKNQGILVHKHKFQLQISWSEDEV